MFKDISGADDEERRLKMLCNFTAEIKQEVRYVDGQNTDTYFVITGRKDGEELETLTVPVEQFATMSWVMKGWGANAVLCEGQGVKDSLRVAMQLLSDNIERRTVYQHTGWIDHEDTENPQFLHVGGAITKNGNERDVTVELPTELKNFDFRIKDNPCSEKEAAVHLMSLLNLAPLHITAPTLCATLRACIAPADFGIHITGRSGSFKSELSSILQCCYGERMDSRHLPCSWGSTANAIEALLYRTKNVMAVVDDFIPVGTTWQVKQFQKTADQIVRAQGNQAGRARLFDTSKLQQTMYPRGLLLSTGEDTPEGQSLRGRLLILEMSKGDVDTDILTECQHRRSVYTLAMAKFIEWQCRHREQVLSMLQEIRETIRDENLEVGHSRTPSMVGDLIAAAAIYEEYAIGIGALSEPGSFIGTCEIGIKEVAGNQAMYLTEADPASLFVASLEAALQSKTVHFRNMMDGQPEHCQALGWKEFKNGEMIDFVPSGVHIGWIDRVAGIMYLKAGNSYEEIRKRSGGSLTIGKSTIWKRLKEAGLLMRTDEVRQRNTVRVTINKLNENVVALNLSSVLDIAQIESEDEAAMSGTGDELPIEHGFIPNPDDDDTPF